MVKRYSATVELSEEDKKSFMRIYIDSDGDMVDMAIPEIVRITRRIFTATGAEKVKLTQQLAKAETLQREFRSLMDTLIKKGLVYREDVSGSMLRHNYVYRLTEMGAGVRAKLVAANKKSLNRN